MSEHSKKVRFIVWNINCPNYGKNPRNNPPKEINDALLSWVEHYLIEQKYIVIVLIECQLRVGNEIKDHLNAQTKSDWQLHQPANHNIKSFANNICIISNISKSPTNKLDFSIRLRSLLPADNPIWGNLFINTGLGIDKKISLIDQITKRITWFSIHSGMNQENAKALVCAVHFFSKVDKDYQFKNDIFVKILKYSFATNQDMVKFFSHKLNFSPQFFPPDKFILLGDFNANPFEPTLYSNNLASEKLNTLPHRTAFDSSIKDSHNFTNRYLYNPCWNLLGDSQIDRDNNLSRTQGYTYFRENPLSNEFYFNLLDGMLFSPCFLKNQFSFEDFRILDSYNNGNVVSLLKRNGSLAIRSEVSDHLPITAVFHF